MRFIALLGLALLLPCPALGADDDIFINRPAFSRGDLPARSSARCEDIRRMSAGLPQVEFRIDLSVTGELTLVKTDGALWYLGMCADVKILCVTYQSNEMKPGDLVRMKGGYSRPGTDHILLDPCLASRPEADSDAQ